MHMHYSLSKICNASSSGNESTNLHHKYANAASCSLPKKQTLKLGAKSQNMDPLRRKVLLRMYGTPLFWGFFTSFTLHTVNRAQFSQKHAAVRVSDEERRKKWQKLRREAIEFHLKLTAGLACAALTTMVVTKAARFVGLMRPPHVMSETTLAHHLGWGTVGCAVLNVPAYAFQVWDERRTKMAEQKEL